MNPMLSYSGLDVEHMNEVARHLRTRSIEPWIDSEGIKPGVKWRNALFDELQSCDAFIPILSKKYLQSEHCRMEAFIARSFGRKILPIMIEDCYDALNAYEETRGLQDIFMVRLHRLSAVGLPISKIDALDRIVAAIRDKYEPVTLDRPVYISYARDAEFATQLANALTAKTVPVWIATLNVKVGENWRDAQARAMLRSVCHLLILDDEMLKRDVLRTEVLLAEARGLPSIAILPPRLSTAAESGVALRKGLEEADQTYRRIAENTFFKSAENVEELANQLRPRLLELIRDTAGNHKEQRRGAWWNLAGRSRGRL